MNDAERAAAIAACPTPVYHETHRYCPSCPWTEADEPGYVPPDKGYLFSVRVGGGPEVFTAWTTQGDGYEPFTQASGDTPAAALEALACALRPESSSDAD